MPNQFYDMLKKLFSRPKQNSRYLVVVIEKCRFMQDELGLVYIVESPNKVKRGMHHSYPCNGLSREMSADEIEICERCRYKRVRIIDAVEPYSYVKAKSLRPEPGTRTLRDVL